MCVVGSRIDQDVDLALFHREDAGRLVRDVAHDDRSIGDRSAVPTWICGQRDAVVLDPLGDDVRAASDRFKAEGLRIVLDGGRRADRKRRHRQVPQERPKRRLQAHRHAIRRRSLHVGDDAFLIEPAKLTCPIGVTEVAVIRILRQPPAVEVELHGLGVERRPVGELQARLQREGPEFSVRRGRPRRGDAGDDRERPRLEAHEIFEGFGGDVERETVGFVRRIETYGVLHARDDQLRARAARRAASATAEQERGEQRRRDGSVHGLPLFSRAAQCVLIVNDQVRDAVFPAASATFTVSFTSPSG